MLPTVIPNYNTNCCQNNDRQTDIRNDENNGINKGNTIQCSKNSHRYSKVNHLNGIFKDISAASLVTSSSESVSNKEVNYQNSNDNQDGDNGSVGKNNISNRLHDKFHTSSAENKVNTSLGKNKSSENTIYFAKDHHDTQHSEFPISATEVDEMDKKLHYTVLTRPIEWTMTYKTKQSTVSAPILKTKNAESLTANERKNMTDVNSSKLSNRKTVTFKSYRDEDEETNETEAPRNDRDHSIYNNSDDGKNELKRQTLLSETSDDTNSDNSSSTSGATSSDSESKALQMPTKKQAWVTESNSCDSSSERSSPRNEDGTGVQSPHKQPLYHDNNEKQGSDEQQLFQRTARHLRISLSLENENSGNSVETPSSEKYFLSYPPATKTEHKLARLVQSSERFGNVSGLNSEKKMNIEATDSEEKENDSIEVSIEPVPLNSSSSSEFSGGEEMLPF